MPHLLDQVVQQRPALLLLLDGVPPVQLGSPAQFFDADGPFGRDAMVVQYDHTVEDFLRAHDVPHERQERVMDVPFRHAEHTH